MGKRGGECGDDGGLRRISNGGRGMRVWRTPLMNAVKVETRVGSEMGNETRVF